MFSPRLKAIYCWYKTATYHVFMNEILASVSQKSRQVVACPKQSLRVCFLPTAGDPNIEYFTTRLKKVLRKPSS